VPPAGSRITASYTRSSGVNGNIGSNLLSSFVESHPSYITISSSTPTTGGTNGETAESLKANIISSIRTQDRAVTLQDYADIAKSVSGVYKAVAAYTPASAGSSAGASVTVYALPFVSDFLTTSSYSITVPTPIKTAVVDKLSTRSMVGVTPVAASSVTLRRLDIIASIQVSEGFVKSWVEANVRNALDGLFTFDNADFGKELKKGEVYKLLMNLTGVDYIDISSFVIKDASNNTITTLDPSHVLRKGTITLTFSGGIGS
jgi:predicted phage baseplate assembly protein